MKKIKRVYIPYWDWEDYQNGMWSIVKKEEEKDLISEAINFTSDWRKYGDAMEKAINNWYNTMFHNLTNSSANKRAFLGQCAVCYKLNLPESIVRKAWKQLTDKQREDADEIAQLLIDEWIEKNQELIEKNANEVSFGDFNKMNFYQKINEYIRIWENRCYKNGIPDDAPKEIFDKVPSYKRISVAILKNDYSLKSLGFTPTKSKYYSILKQIEIEGRNNEN